MRYPIALFLFLIAQDAFGAEILLRWKAPPAGQGPAVEMYEVRRQDGVSPEWKYVGQTTSKVRQLMDNVPPGQTYTYVCLAWGGNTWSQPSNQVTVVVTGSAVTGAPQYLTVTVSGDGSVRSTGMGEGENLARGKVSERPAWPPPPFTTPCRDEITGKVIEGCEELSPKR